MNCHKINPRVLFDTINHIVSLQHQHAALLSDDDCDTFRNHCVNKAMNLRSKISSSRSPYEDGPQCTESFISSSPISLNDLTSVILKCSLDKLPSSILSGSFVSIGPLLRSIINISLRQCCFPSYFKHAEVTPLLKKTNLKPSASNNYHPI